MPVKSIMLTKWPLSGQKRPSADWIRGGVMAVVAVTAVLFWPAPAVPLPIAAVFAASALLLGYRLAERQAEPGTNEPIPGLLPQEGVRTALDRHLASPQAEARKGALIHCELSATAAITAPHGLHLEEKLIEEAMARLATILPADAAASRAGHGTFLVFLPGMSDPMEVVGLARAITSSLAGGIEDAGLRRPLSCQIGIALAPQDGTTAEDLLRSAELALAAARGQDSPGYGFFDPLSAAAAARRLDVQRAIVAAHAAQSLRLVYQPIHHMRSGELAGFEALMRLDDPELGAIPPSEFIPAAEEAGLINGIGNWALDDACRTAALWPAHLVVAVNLSPAQFMSGTIVQAVRQSLERHGLPAYRLEVEITEGTLMQDSELVLSQLRILREMGVGVALDDFGTGYSSLGYLWKFPFSKLKIDRSFVVALDVSASAKGILRSIVKLGHGLGMTVTAEGIESPRQLAGIRELGCDMVQGYLLGKPCPQDELAAIIMRNFALHISRRTRQTARPAAAISG